MVKGQGIHNCTRGQRNKQQVSACEPHEGPSLCPSLSLSLSEYIYICIYIIKKFGKSLKAYYFFYCWKSKGWESSHVGSNIYKYMPPLFYALYHMLFLLFCFWVDCKRGEREREREEFWFIWLLIWFFYMKKNQFGFFFYNLYMTSLSKYVREIR